MNDLTLRPGEEKDLPDLLEIHNHFVRETAVTFEMEEVTLENRCEWLQGFDERGPHQLLIAESEDGVIGYAASSRYLERPAYARSVMTSVYLHPDHTGRGIGRILYQALIDQLIRSDAVHRAYALVRIPNPASESLHGKLGFREVGVLDEAGYKLGSYHSVRIYERRMD
ncbi:MAG: GNAT family N-acetyltransferase [Opitutales bacterium]|jgi:phosphinothricin acetyltransferase